MGNVHQVVSANIRFANKNDGDHDWKYRRELMTSVLLQDSPLLIGTQEGRQEQLRDLEGLLKNYILIDSHRDWIEERMYPCLFLRKDRGSVIKSGDIWLSETPHIPGSSSFDSAFPRLATYAEIELNNKKLLVVNLHLDHLQATTRAEQAKVLVQEIQPLFTKNSPLILMGDFNEDPSGQVREEINKGLTSLNDPWLYLNKDEETSFHKFHGELESGSRIDWILTDNKLGISDIFLDKSQRDGLFPSDHFPVKCNLKF